MLALSTIYHGTKRLEMDPGATVCLRCVRDQLKLVSTRAEHTKCKQCRAFTFPLQWQVCAQPVAVGRCDSYYLYCANFHGGVRQHIHGGDNDAS